jgi:hypothetical protein
MSSFIEIFSPCLSGDADENGDAADERENNPKGSAAEQLQDDAQDDSSPKSRAVPKNAATASVTVSTAHPQQAQQHGHTLPHAANTYMPMPRRPVRAMSFT